MSRAKPLKSRTPGPDRDTYVAVSGYQGCKHGPIRSVPGHANASIGLGGGLARHGTGAAIVVGVHGAHRPTDTARKGNDRKRSDSKGLAHKRSFSDHLLALPESSA